MGKKMANPREEILYFPGYAVRLTVKSSIISALFLTDKRMVTSRGLTLGMMCLRWSCFTGSPIVWK